MATNEELEKRIETLEKEVQHLKEQLLNVVLLFLKSQFFFLVLQ